LAVQSGHLLFLGSADVRLPAEHIAMHSPEEWHRHAGNNLNEAERTRRKAHEQCSTSRRTHEQTSQGQYTAFNDLQECMEKKVNNSCKMIELLRRREGSLVQSINLTAQTRSHLEMAHEAKDSPLRLCVWRLDRRSRRPRRELIKDRVEESLEAQKVQLIETQRKLADAIAKASECIASLERKLEQVRDDLSKKQQALSVDDMCLRSTMRTLLEKAPTAVQQGSGRHTPVVSREVAAAQQRSFKVAAVTLRDTAKNEDNRFDECIRLDHAALTQEAAAKALREKNSKLIQLCDGIAKMSATKAGQSLQDRINENQQMRSRLVHAIKETQEKIEHTKSTMSGTKSEMKSIQDPIKLCNSCNSARKYRAPGEHIEDPVSTHLAEHEMALFRSNEELRRTHQNEKASLSELRQRVENLQEDLSDKSEALRIDVSCLTNDSVQYQFSTRRGPGKEHDTFAKASARPRSAGSVRAGTMFVPSYDFTGSGRVPSSMR